MTHRFGWCEDSRHQAPADDPDGGGCPGQIGGPDGLTCDCPCHTETTEST